MKLSSLALITASVGAIVPVHAASLIAGFDFSNWSLGAPGNSIDSTVSDITGDVGTGGTSNGTLYWDTSFGSGADGINSGNPVVNTAPFGPFSLQATSGSLSSNNAINTDSRNSSFSLINPTPRKFTGNNVDGTGDISGDFIVFSIAGSDQFYSDVLLTYGAIGSQSTSIDWYYSNNGSDYVFAETDSIGTSDAVQSTAFSGLGNTNGEFFIGALFGTVAQGNSVSLDNLQFQGNVVPEPSTYAAIAGALVLGLAVYRRRK